MFSIVDVKIYNFFIAKKNHSKSFPTPRQWYNSTSNWVINLLYAVMNSIASWRFPVDQHSVGLAYSYHLIVFGDSLNELEEIPWI